MVNEAPLKETNIRQLLKRFLLGNASETEIDTVDNWYSSFDAEQITLSEEESAATGEEIWHRIEPVTRTGVPGAERKVRALRTYLRAASVILFIAGEAI